MAEALIWVCCACRWDSGSTVGEFTGHSKRALSCAFKPTRPFRIITCGEDMLVNFYEGPPFRFKASFRHVHFEPKTGKESGADRMSPGELLIIYRMLDSIRVLRVCSGIICFISCISSPVNMSPCRLG